MDNDQTIFQSQSSPTQPLEPVPASVSQQPSFVSPVESLTQPATVSPVPEAPVESVQTPAFYPPVNPVPSEQFVQSPPAEIVANEPIVQNPPSQNPVKPAGGNAVALLKKFFKVGIGLIVVLVIIALLFTVILPKLLGNANSKVTLTYWGLWEDSNTMQSLIADFERQNPNITINYSMQDPKQYRERVLTRIANGNGPDIFRFHNTWYPMYASVLLPLPVDTMTSTDFKKTFYPVAQNDLVKNGAIYGIPLEIDTLSLYVNTSLFQTVGLQPPTNWNDFINDARELTVKDADGKIKTAGAALGTYDNITHAPDIMSLLFLQNGVNVSKMQDSSDRATNALNFYTSFATDQNNVWDNTLDPSILAFSKGNLAMYFGYSWDYFTIKQDNPNLNFKLVPVPQLPNQNINLASYWAEGISVKSTHQKEALLFIKFLAQKSTEESLYAQQAKTRAFGEPYARVDLGATLKTNPVLGTVINQSASALSSPFIDNTYDNGLNQQLNTYLGNAINAVINGDSPQTAIATLIDGVTQVLQKYGQ